MENKKEHGNINGMGNDGKNMTFEKAKQEVVRCGEMAAPSTD